MGTGCVGAPLGARRFSKTFAKRRTVWFACWAPELLLCYENVATSPPTAYWEGAPEPSSAGRLRLLLLTGAAGLGLFTHQGRGVSGKKPHGQLSLDMSLLPAVSGLNWQTLSNNVPQDGHIFS